MSDANRGSFGGRDPRAPSVSQADIAGAGGVLPDTTLRYWRVAMLRTVDELKLSYALRCRVYCEERGFLPLAEYPEGIESDKYDDYSLHFGSFDGEGEMVGSARLVLRSPLGFPMFDHCVVDPEWQRRIEAIPKLVEISRLVVSRRYRRRANDGHYGINHPVEGGNLHPDAAERRQQFSVAVSLFKAMYQASQRLQITHALSAMELTLLRLLQRYHFPFEKIGPECDYFGPVTPFILDAVKTEERLAADCPELHQEFREGLNGAAAGSFVV